MPTIDVKCKVELTHKKSQPRGLAHIWRLNSYRLLLLLLLLLLLSFFSSSSSSSSGGIISSFASFGLLNYFLPFNPIPDVFCRITYFHAFKYSFISFSRLSFSPSVSLVDTGFHSHNFLPFYHLLFGMHGQTSSTIGPYCSWL